MLQELLVAGAATGSVCVVYVAAAARVVKQYERGVVFRLGRVAGEVRAPGFTMVVPFVDKLRKVNMQIVTMPGHTAGTLSFLFEIKDNGKPLRVAYVGGTAIPFDNKPDYYDTYIASSRKMANRRTSSRAASISSS